MLIIIRDINIELIGHCMERTNDVAPHADISFNPGHMFQTGTSADAIVSPANSFGFMDGGIDLVYSRFFGWDLQEKVKAKIAQDFAGELLVGQAFAVPTGLACFPNLIVAPTMRVPSRILEPVDVYLATRAAIRCAITQGFESVVLPGMGTGCGAVPFAVAARNMMDGIKDALAPLPYPTTFVEAIDRHIQKNSPETRH